MTIKIPGKIAEINKETITMKLNILLDLILKSKIFNQSNINPS